MTSVTYAGAAAMIRALLDCTPEDAVDFLANHAEAFEEIAGLLDLTIETLRELRATLR